MEKALREKAWDFIFYDYNLPRFSGPEALALFKRTGLPTPFVLVSGTVGEETAVEMVKAGADDFLLKGSWARLIPIVERELRRAAVAETRRGNSRAQMREWRIVRLPFLVGRFPMSLLIAGVLCLSLAAFLMFDPASPRRARLAPDWHWEGSYIGIMTEPDPRTRSFPSPDKAGLYDRAARIVGPAPGGEAVIVEDRFTIRDPATNKPTWEYILRSAVDPRTGRHTAQAYRGDHYIFPRDTQKTGYRLRFNYLEGVPVAYEKEETVEGIPVYVFAYRGRAVYTRCYAGTPDYPGVPVKEGQDIRCADDQFFLRLWVEPLTGEILKLDEGCLSGDWIYETASNRAIQPLIRWGGVNTGDDLLLRAARIRAERQTIFWRGFYLPAGLLIAGLALAAAALILRRRQKSALRGGGNNQ